MLRPAILATVFIRMMDALRTVDEVWMLTGGGPGAATRYVGLYIWRVVFPKTDYGYGSAMSLITLYLTIVMCWLLYVALVARRGQQEAGVMRATLAGSPLSVLDRRQPGDALPDLLDVRDLGEEPRPISSARRASCSTSFYCDELHQHAEQPDIPRLHDQLDRRRDLQRAPRHRARPPRRPMRCRAIQLAGKENIFFWTITNRMAPAAVFLLPLFLLYTQAFTIGDWKLYDTRLGLILLYCVFNLPFAIWTLRGIDRRHPEGARRGGHGRWRDDLADR